MRKSYEAGVPNLEVTRYDHVPSKPVIRQAFANSVVSYTVLLDSLVVYCRIFIKPASHLLPTPRSCNILSIHRPLNPRTLARPFTFQHNQHSHPPQLLSEFRLENLQYEAIISSPTLSENDTTLMGQPTMSTTHLIYGSDPFTGDRGLFLSFSLHHASQIHHRTIQLGETILRFTRRVLLPDIGLDQVIHISIIV